MGGSKTRATLGIGPRGASRRALLAGIAVLTAVAPNVGRADAAAAALIETFHERLLQLMREAKALGFDGRARAIAPAVASTFDYATMTRIACGKAWAGMSVAEQAALIDAFRAYGVANYAANFDDYSGQSFRTLGIEPARGERLTVRTQLVRAPGKGDPVAIDYLVQPSGDGWRAIDVVVDGKLSELARRRSEFGGILRRGGASELLAVLTQETAALGA